MIHFFPLFDRAAANTPYGDAIRATGVPHRIFATAISFAYRSRLQVLLISMPRLAAFALRAGFASLALSRPAPDAVVISSDIEALIFAALRFLTRRRTRIVLSPFIRTEKRSTLVDALHRAYYAFVLRAVDVAIVHSRLEVARYQALFPRAATRFAFVPYGMGVEDHAALLAAAAPAPAEASVLVAAGKSGRDYATLVRAVHGLAAETRIICNYAPSLPALPPGNAVRVLSDCHGVDYLREVANATIVIVPLAVADISAGQMAVIQAMALARPLIITDTPTVRDYATHEGNALLVPMGDAAALRAAIARLLADAPLRARLAAAAAETYARRHTTHRFAANLVAAILGKDAHG